MTRTLTLATVLLTLIVAAPAGAATLSLNQKCYQEQEPVQFTGGAFTPNSAVNFSVDGLAIGSRPTDPAGNVSGTFPAPKISGKQRRFSVEARDASNPANVFTANPLATSFGVSVKPKAGNPARKRKIKARGFTDGKRLYVHVKGSGKARNIGLGKLKKPCGTKSLTKRIFKKGTKTGVYTVQFDTKRRYSAGTFPRVTFTVTIFTRVRRSLAGAAFVTGERWVQTSTSG